MGPSSLLLPAFSDQVLRRGVGASEEELTHFPYEAGREHTASHAVLSVTLLQSRLPCKLGHSSLWAESSLTHTKWAHTRANARSNAEFNSEFLRSGK